MAVAAAVTHDAKRLRVACEERRVRGFPSAAVGDEGVSDDEEAVWRGIWMSS
jgi:hypothetical protein